MNGNLLKGEVENLDNAVQMSGYTQTPQFWNNMPSVEKDCGVGMLENKLWEVLSEYATHHSWEFGIHRTDEFVENSGDYIYEELCKRFPLSDAGPAITMQLDDVEPIYHISVQAYRVRVRAKYFFGVTNGQYPK